MSALNHAKAQLLSVVAALDADELRDLGDYFNELVYHKTNGAAGSAPSENEENDGRARVLEAILSDLRATVGVDAQAPGEQITLPQDSNNFDGYNPDTTVHVDSFLYTDDDLDDLVERGEFSRNYCTQCGSHATRPLQFISHSAGQHQLMWLFTKSMRGTLEQLAEEKSAAGAEPRVTVLDVGSRLGAVLYMGYLFAPPTTSFIGIEFNPYFAALSSSVIQKYNMTDRAAVMQDDVRNRLDLLASSDVVIFHNAFQCFVNRADEVHIWNLVRAHMTRPGQRIVAIPSLEVQFAECGVTVRLEGWVREVVFDSPEELEETLEGLDGDEVDDIRRIHEYVVLG
ncbi:hypothetical protein BJ742DRAFT_84969 [Cladochytrium replicatum]|nr:hypothetical protein BJ742DRAFT_84969 [Cladochytrium replicatum]